MVSINKSIEVGEELQTALINFYSHCTKQGWIDQKGNVSVPDHIDAVECGIASIWFRLMGETNYG